MRSRVAAAAAAAFRFFLVVGLGGASSGVGFSIGTSQLVLFEQCMADFCIHIRYSLLAQSYKASCTSIMFVALILAEMLVKSHDHG